MPSPTAPTGALRLLVPWRSVVVLVEVPAVGVADRVAGLGMCSGNRVVAIGYDAIPVVSADMVPPVESAKFTRYLTVIKSAVRVAGISVTATAEFAGFARMLPTQGLSGPIVGEVSLPSPAAAPQSGWVGPSQPTNGVGGRLPRAAQESSRGPARRGDSVARRSAVLRRVHRRQRLGRGVPPTSRSTGLRRPIDPGQEGRVRRRSRLGLRRGVVHRIPVTARGVWAAGRGIVRPRRAGDHLQLRLDCARLPPAVGPCSSTRGTIAGSPTPCARLLTDRDRLAELRAEIAGRAESTWADYGRGLWEFLVVPELAGLADLPERAEVPGGDRREARRAAS